MFQILRHIRRPVARMLLPVLALSWLSGLAQPCLALLQSQTEAAGQHAAAMHCCCEQAPSESQQSCERCSCPDMRAADAGIPAGLTTSFCEQPQAPVVLVSALPGWSAAAIQGHAPDRPPHGGTPSTHPALRFQRLLI